MKKRLPELDALRGVAAISVVLFHIFVLKPGYKWTTFGVTGVDLFFLISGFVIFMSIQHAADARQFIGNRFARLFPVYWTCVSLTFAFYLLEHLVVFGEKFSIGWLGTYAANMTMLQNYFGVKNLDMSYWTLLVELQFYALIVVLYQLKLLKQIEKIGIAILLIILAFTIVFGNDPAVIKKVVAYAPILNHFALFFAGIMFFKLTFKQVDQYRAFAIILCCFLLQVYIFDHAGTAFFYISRVKYVCALSVYFLCFVLLVYQKLSFINNRVLLFLGKISYPLYVVHQFISINFLMPFLLNRLKAPVWLAGSATIVFVIILAALITNYIEIPCRSVLKQYFAKAPKPGLDVIAT